VDRFGLLAPEFMDESNDEQALTEKILSKLGLGNYQLGRTKVFLRAGQIGILDSRRAEVLDASARLIQRRLRTFVTHQNFISARASAISIQAYCRGSFLIYYYSSSFIVHVIFSCSRNFCSLYQFLRNIQLSNTLFSDFFLLISFAKNMFT
jgi:myosin heavy subunit